MDQILCTGVMQRRRMRRDALWLLFVAIVVGVVIVVVVCYVWCCLCARSCVGLFA